MFGEASRRLGRCLAAETPTEAEHAVLELASLLNAEVRVTQIILKALEARIVGLKKVVRLHRLLVAEWMGGCARLYGVHSGHPFCGPGPGELQLLRGLFFSNIHSIHVLHTIYN
jgi:hypothetical protein